MTTLSPAEGSEKGHISDFFFSPYDSVGMDGACRQDQPGNRLHIYTFPILIMFSENDFCVSFFLHDPQKQLSPFSSSATEVETS